MGYLAVKLSSRRIKSATPWPLCSVDCYLQLISMVDQVRHPLWQPMLNGILPSTYLHERSNPPPPLTTMFNGMVPSVYLHKGSNGPTRPRLINILNGGMNGILTSTYLHKGSNPLPPLNNVLDGIWWDFNFHLSLEGIKPPPPLNNIYILDINLYI